MSFFLAFKRTIGVEGKYSNNPNDSGGETMYGITKRVAVANGYTGEMKNLSLVRAADIAKVQYWDLLNLDKIDSLSSEIAVELFDTGYNAGIATAGRFLQRALNAFNRQQKDYQDITVDGVVGPLTVSNLRAFLTKRKDHGEAVMLRALNALQGSYYLSLVEQRPKDEDFIFGWFSTRL